MKSVILIFCVFLPTTIIAKPVNKHSSNYEMDKGATVCEKNHFEVFAVKSSTDAFKFLTQFGYNPCENSPWSKSDDRDGQQCQSNIESMLQAFQSAFHLPVTKKLDAATLKLMNTPRCGLPDSSPSLMDKNKLW
jgi:hypothetical protein